MGVNNVKDEEGKTLTTNPEETLNVLIDKHFGKMTNDNHGLLNTRPYMSHLRGQN